MEITIAPHFTRPPPVSRLGYGTMRLTGPNTWDKPANRPEALGIFRQPR